VSSNKIRGELGHHRAAVEAARTADWPARIAIAAVAGLGVFIVALVMMRVVESDVGQPAPIVKGPKYNEVPAPTHKPSVVREPAPTAVENAAERVNLAISDHSDDHRIRMLPNLSGTGAVEDGQTYSVALIVATPEIPVGTKLLAQGRVANFGYAGVLSRPFAIIRDEQQTEITLLCAMMAEEGTEVVSLYHEGEAVQVAGDYMGVLPVAGNPSMPILRDCNVAGPTSNVVRPARNSSR
jgi:hypothetical protein